MKKMKEEETFNEKLEQTHVTPKPVPNKYPTIQVVMTKELKQKIQEQANLNKLSLSEYTLQLITKQLQTWTFFYYF